MLEPGAAVGPTDTASGWLGLRVGIDVGGTMCKICYLETPQREDEPPSETITRERLRVLVNDPETYGESGIRDRAKEFDSEELGGHIYFVQFESRKMEKVLEMFRAKSALDASTVVYGTGGGARKYATKIKDLLGISIKHCDELQSLIFGINFMLHHDPSALYQVDPESFLTDGTRITPRAAPKYPYLLVNIGSGVSILRVDADGSHTRVGGSSLGGATFFGLCCIVTGCATFTDAMAFAERGDSKNIDLLVEDIYGGDYEEFELPGSTVASSLGKLVKPEIREKAQAEDVARALLEAITNNIGSIALLHARAHNCEKIIFAGNFLRNNRISIARLSFSMDYWSEGRRHANFLVHEGYLGAFGALLQGRDITHSPSVSPEPPHPIPTTS